MNRDAGMRHSVFLAGLLDRAEEGVVVDSFAVRAVAMVYICVCLCNIYKKSGGKKERDQISVLPPHLAYEKATPLMITIPSLSINTIITICQSILSF